MNVVKEEFLLLSYAPPAFGTVEPNEIAGYPPSPSVFRVSYGTLDDTWCILKDTSTGKFYYRLMHRTKTRGWRESPKVTGPMAAAFNAAVAGRQIVTTGHLTLTKGGGVKRI